MIGTATSRPLRLETLMSGTRAAGMAFGLVPMLKIGSSGRSMPKSCIRRLEADPVLERVLDHPRAVIDQLGVPRAAGGARITGHGVDRILEAS